MAIESALRARQVISYTKGEKVFFGEEIYEEGILSTKQRQGNIKVQFQGTAHFPQTLVLRARLVPVPFQTLTSQAEDYPTQVQYMNNSQAKNTISFYALSSAYAGFEALAQSSWYKAVELRYQHYGLQDGKPFQGSHIRQNLQIILDANKVIYRKDFHFQTKNRLIQRYVIVTQDHWVVTDAHGTNVINGTPLMAYGGFYRSGITIDKIGPVFAVIACHSDFTDLRLFSLSALKEKGVMPPYGGKCGASQWYFADKLPRSFLLPLSASLQEGFAEVVLEDQTTKETCRYISKNYTYVGAGYTEIDITFVQNLKKGV